MSLSNQINMGKDIDWDLGGYAVGGGTLIGLGIGFFFLKTSPLAFVGSLLMGIGFGLLIVPIVSKK